MTKSEVAHTLGILLSLDNWRDLMSLKEDTLFQMYRNYNANALAYNHQEDKLRELQDKVTVIESRDPTRKYTRKNARK